jgi:hypothetical protein
MTDEETPKEFALQMLRAIATFAKAPLRDRLPDGEIVEVSAKGEVLVLSGAEAEEVAQALDTSSGARPSSAFDYLDGYHVLVPGSTAKGGTPKSLEEECEMHVAGLAPLRKRLDELLANPKVPDMAQDLHRELRRLCDESVRLRLGLVIGS